MASITDTITELEGKVFEVLDSVQAPVVDIVKQAAGRLDDVLPENRPSLPDAIPAPAELVDFGFGFAQKLLTDQHDFVKSLLVAAAPLIPQPAKKVKAAPKAKATAAA
ncbi:MAG: hypothetical protein QOE63_2038 [Acidimicrobiaceae bacterium]|jgi:hypothetical protein